MIQHQKSKELLVHFLPSLIVFIVLGAFLLYAFMQIKALSQIVQTLQNELITTKITLSSNTTQLSKNIKDLSKETLGISNTLTNTRQNIDAVKSQVGNVETNIGSISGTVNNLQKLSKVDPQLLKKYSKVYFMNENYTPAHLTVIPTEYLYSSSHQEQFQSETWGSLKNLLDAAQKDGVQLYVKSAYRSFAEQKTLKSSYTVAYGAGTANAFSADQGYSEHQLGTTLDFITTGQNGQLTTSFDSTAAYIWLTANAYRFGFILSYPKGNKYYIYEPWHWRYVGVKLATYLHANNLNFYDLDQRDIDAYIINFFD